MPAVLALAERLRRGEPAVAAFDAPLGLPRTYLQAAGYASFVEWLASAPFDTLFAPVTGPDEWSPARPFVRPVFGGWTGAVAVARRHGIDLWRAIDRRTNAESMFKLVGPKQVGRAAQEVWRELRAARASRVAFRIWPFEANLEADGVVVAEIYPRVAYEEVLGPLRFVKMDRAARADALARVAPDVRIADVAAAAATDDDFDACVTVVALLRRAASGAPVADDASVDPFFEGGILCA